MKFLRRYFCVLLFCLLSLGAFSVGVSAEESTTIKSDSVQIYHYHRHGGPYTGPGQVFYPNNGVVEKHEYALPMSSVPSSAYSSVYRLRYDDKRILVEEGDKVHVRFDNVYFQVLVSAHLTDHAGVQTTEHRYFNTPSSISALVKYADGTEKSYINGVTFNHKTNSNFINIDLEFEPYEDVDEIYFNVYMSDLSKKIPSVDNYSSVSYTLTYYSGEFNGDDKYQFQLGVQSEEAGWLESIFNFIVDFPSLIWDIFKAPFETIFGFLGDILDSILELPKLLWELIEAGLKALFVPSESFIVEFKDDMDSMLSQKLGAVYQVIDIMGNSWDSITANDVQNVIHIPETTIPLGDNSFSFGGYDVPIVPYGFEFIVDILKTVIGISATVLFVNGLRKKYDDVIGGK